MKDGTTFNKADFESLAEFRYQLRRFLHISEALCKAESITPLQYQLMLQIKGYPGRSWALVGELAERLQLAQHGVVALVTRAEDAGLVTRVRADSDRRQVQVHLTPLGSTRIRRLALLHRRELQSLSKVLGRFDAAEA